LLTGSASVSAQPPLLVEVFANIDILDDMDSKADVYLTFVAVLHAAAAQIWNHKQQIAVAKFGSLTPNGDVELLNDAFGKHLSVLPAGNLCSILTKRVDRRP